MYFNALCATFTAFVASAAAVSVASLNVKVTGEPLVFGIESLVVKTTVTNTGDKNLTLLNHPKSPLSKLPANTFTITDATGITPTFIGIKAKYVPATAIAAGKDAITVLAPGQFVEVEHNLLEAYAFSKEGEYIITSNNLFYAVDSRKQVVPIYATVEAHAANLIGKFDIRRNPHDKRVAYNGCSSSQQTSLINAASGAQTYAANASSYSNTSTIATPRYSTWFGTYTQLRHNITTSHFSRINSNDFSSYIFDCTCMDAGTYAYVYPDQFGEVYLCGAFWGAHNTGTDSKAGTLIHESSHFTANGGTEDYVYGQDAAKNLAVHHPDQAVLNADNHEYFAENNPAQT